MKRARLKYSLVLALIISLSLALYAYFDSGKSGIGWFTGVFTFLFITPLIYFRASKNIKVGKFAYDLKESDQVLYSTPVNYYDDILYFGRSLFPKTMKSLMGGNLYLLKDRLVFQTNLLNYSNRREVVVHVRDIYCIVIDSDCPFNKSFAVETDKDVYTFYAAEREQWKNQILRCKGALS